VVRVAPGDMVLTGRVVDEANIISASEEIALTDQLETLEKDTTDQLVVITVKSLDGKSIEQLARQLGNRWGIGRADVDNGVILLIAPSDRQVRIEVGLGLEGLLTDQRAAAIVRHMLPLFSKGRSAQAIESGVSEISSVLRADKRRPYRKLQKEAA
jgi:uncharacterized protein